MSDAVDSSRVSAVTGYKITKGDFRLSSPNLPQRIAILAEANEANQSTLDLTPTQVTSAQQVGNLYGFGSPSYMIARILFPINGGDGVGGIPVYMYPQAKASGASDKVLRITPAGTATGNATHTVKLCGRTNMDGSSYNINIVTGDTVAIISGKIKDAINAAVGAPVIAVDYGYDCDLTTKWKGLTANDVNVTIETNGSAVGMTYAVTSPRSGSGTPSIAAALALFANNWNTIVINSYGTDTTTMGLLEAFNGIPDPTNPTGRYTGTIMKPFVALCGSIADDPSSITDGRLNDVTCAICPAPLSTGLPMEAAANTALLLATNCQDTPHLDIGGQSYPDMPTPVVIGSMATYTNRDAIVKKGCSTVNLVGGRYQLEDMVTTYHPTGEIPPQFRYVRNIMLDLNVYYGYKLLEETNVVGHVIAADNDTVNAATNVIKPKIWKQVLKAYSEDLVNRALITDAAFMQTSTSVTLSSSNPDRLNTFFRYKRTGTVRISSTEAQAGFSFGG